MTKQPINIFITVCLTILIAAGGVYRLVGISKNHSFWSDEAFTSSIAAQIVQGEISLAKGISYVKYEPLQILMLAASFKIIGENEFAARIPSVVWGILGIYACYLLAKRLSNPYGGLLGAFTYAFIQANLSYSTQAKPYAAIETIFLFTIYLVSTIDKKNRNLAHHLTIIFMIILATLIHNLGIICAIPYLVYLLHKIVTQKALRKGYILLLVIGLLASIFIIRQYLPFLIFPKHNNFIYINYLFWRQYGLYTLPAIAGLIMLKDKGLVAGISITFLSLLYSWSFVVANHEFRYILPLLGVIISLFGSFWGNIGRLLKGGEIVIPVIVAFLLFLGGDRIIRKPSIYYTPNADLAGDIQNADYKRFFGLWREKYPDFEKYPIFAGPFDSLSWYANKYPTASFNKFATEPVYRPEFGFVEYSTLATFITETSKYPKGFAMIHDWISFMPDEIKGYIKKNMKFELSVESLSVSPNDRWPLLLYSWGFDGESRIDK